MTVTLYRWARSASEAAQLQAEGWEPRPRSLDTHHGHYALLHRKMDLNDMPYIPALDFDAEAHA